MVEETEIDVMNECRRIKLISIDRHENNEEETLTNARMMTAVVATVLTLVCRDDGGFVPSKRSRSFDRSRSFGRSKHVNSLVSTLVACCCQR